MLRVLLLVYLLEGVHSTVSGWQFPTRTPGPTRRAARSTQLSMKYTFDYIIRTYYHEYFIFGMNHLYKLGGDGSGEVVSSFGVTRIIQCFDSLLDA